MDYGQILRQAWNLTWRHRFLWIIGLFATTTVGSCSFNAGGSGSGWQTNSREMDLFVPGASDLGRAFGFWAAENAGFIVAIALLAFLVGLGIFLVTMVAQGAMARATVNLARGQESNAGEAWRTGLRYFWHYLALWLLLLALVIGVAVLLAIFGAAGVVFFAVADEGTRIALSVVGGLLLFALVLLVIPVIIALAIVVAYAQRVIVAEDVGPLAALNEGFRLLRANLGQSLVAWLVNLGLSIGAGLVIAAATVLAAIPLGAIAVILYDSTGLSPTVVAYGIVAAIILGLVVWLLGGFINTYFWNYWTLVYLRLRPQPPVAANPEREA